MSDSEKTMYVQALLEYAAADARQAYIGVTGTLAVVLIFVSQIDLKYLQGLSGFWTVVLLIGLAFLLGAAGLFFAYALDVHHARRDIAKYLLKPSEVTETAPDNVLTRTLNRWNPIALPAAKFLTFFGLLLLGTVFAVLL